MRTQTHTFTATMRNLGQGWEVLFGGQWMYVGKVRKLIEAGPAEPLYWQAWEVLRPHELQQHLWTLGGVSGEECTMTAVITLGHEIPGNKVK